MKLVGIERESIGTVRDSIVIVVGIRIIPDPVVVGVLKLSSIKRESIGFIQDSIVIIVRVVGIRDFISVVVRRNRARIKGIALIIGQFVNVCVAIVIVVGIGQV